MLRVRRRCQPLPSPGVPGLFRAGAGRARRSCSVASASCRYWYVVPGSRRDEDTPAVGYQLVKGQRVFRCAHLNPAVTGIEPQELIGIGMRFEADVAANGNRHEGDLQIAAAPGNGPVIRVDRSCFFDVERLRCRADILDRQVILHLERTDRMREPCARMPEALRERIAVDRGRKNSRACGLFGQFVQASFSLAKKPSWRGLFLAPSAVSSA